MDNVIPIGLPLLLLGRWRSEEDDGRSEYIISRREGELSVFAFDFVDGEEYSVSNIQFDQGMVAFDTLMPSTGREGHVRLEALSEVGRAKQTFTFTDTVTLARLPNDGTDNGTC